jgi:pyruvyltransferase
MNRAFKNFFWVFLVFSTVRLPAIEVCSLNGLPLYYWRQEKEKLYNFGDCMSVKLVERILGGPVEIYKKTRLNNKKKLLAIGSIFSFGLDGDVAWGTGINGKLLDKHFYSFSHIDVRAVRGPLTRDFLMTHFNINCPEIYGDPALLTSYFFPEFKRKDYPSHDYIIIPHYSEEYMFPKEISPMWFIQPTLWKKSSKKFSILNL